MSQTIPSRPLPELLMTSRYSRCSSGSRHSSASSLMPRIALSGVRISWLMFATNSDLARVARSAVASVRCSSRVRACTSRSSRAA